MESLGLYIHIPFCKSKCYYCDFLSFPKKKSLAKKYMEYLNKEIDLYSKILKDYTVKTIFIGGGTPSYLDGDEIANLLSRLKNYIDISRVEEITIESNPNTLDEEKLIKYLESGINRISLGVQSMIDRELKSIGRTHNKEDVYKSYDLIRKLGFDNANIDIMFGLPNQSISNLLKTLKTIVELDVEHISFYGLIVEEETKFSRWLNQGKISLPDEAAERKMYHEGKKYLIENGYKHYEISNFSKQGFKSIHNMFYWNVRPYIGMGLGAHSNLKNTRYFNQNNFKKYFRDLDNNKLPIEQKEFIDKEMEIAEYLILGLRLIEGIDKNDFSKRFNLDVEKFYKNVIKKHRKNGLIEVDDRKIRLTNKGLDLANQVFIDFYPG